MKRLMTAYFAYVPIIVLTAFLLCPAGANVERNIATQAARQGQCGMWSVVPSPNVNTGDSSLGAVAAASPSDVWAVGNQVDAKSTIAKTLTEHWNGTTWTIVASPNIEPFGNTLFGVAAVSSDNAWTVGYAVNKNHIAQTLIERWDGTSWNIVPSPNPGDTYNLLYGVTAISASDAWAVGYEQDNHHFQTLIEHWDGTDWNVVSSPNPGSSNNVLYAVKAVAANDVWAVGQYLNTDITDQALLEHWDGHSWHVLAHPHTTSSSTLYGVAATTERIWAVGNLESDITPMQTLVEQGHDRQWSIAASPNVGSSDNQLFSTVLASNSNLWAAGDYLDTKGNYQTLIEHSDGEQWNTVPSPSPGSGSNILGGMTALSEQDIWAVGTFDAGGNRMTLIEHYC